MMTSVGADTIDVNELRRAFGCFVTGVTVVTTVAGDGQPRGFTASSFTSVSLDPPLVLVCVAKSASSHAVFQAAGAFAINILAEDQREISAAFASRTADKFATAPWTRSSAGNPLLPDCSAWLDCVMHDQHEAGDHLILIGRVRALAHSPRIPLGYYSGSYVGFGMERRAVDSAAADKHVVVGGIFEKNRQVLLLSRNGELHLPEAHRLGSEGDQRDSLFAVLAGLGIRITVSFIYAVFQDHASGVLHVFYRGEIIEDSVGGGAARLISLEQIAEQPIASKTSQHMLRRYAREQLSSDFGVYVGSSTKGVVQTLSGPQPPAAVVAGSTE
jgi:flavin-dependent trigonelline monooxygenase, reductase component